MGTAIDIFAGRNCNGTLEFLRAPTSPARPRAGTPLRLRDVSSHYNLIAVAFANATSTPGAVSFSIDPGLSSALGGYSSSDFINDVNFLHGQGRHVIISVGGQNGTISVGDRIRGLG